MAAWMPLASDPWHLSSGLGGAPPSPHPFRFPASARGRSSVGRALALQARGRRFESARLHQLGSGEGLEKEMVTGDGGLRRSVVRLPWSVIGLLDIVKDVTVASALPALAPSGGGVAL